MSEASAAQWYFDPPDPPGSEPCDECSGTRWPRENHEEHCSLYGVDEAPLEEEPYDLEDYMMRQKGLIE